MTREEAIKRLEANRGAFVFKETNEALDMAIEALQANNVEHDDIVRVSVTDRKKEKVILYDAFGEIEYYPTTQTIPTFTESAEAYKAWTGEEMGRPQGEWIECHAYNPDIDADVPYIECDQCGHRPYFSGSYRSKYCEECGAKMDGNTDNPHGFTADEWYRNTFKDGDAE